MRALGPVLPLGAPREMRTLVTVYSGPGAHCTPRHGHHAVRVVPGAAAVEKEPKGLGPLLRPYKGLLALLALRPLWPSLRA